MPGVLSDNGSSFFFQLSGLHVWNFKECRGIYSLSEKTAGNKIVLKTLVNIFEIVPI